MAVTGHPDFLRASTLVDQPLLIGLELNAVLPKTSPVLDVRRWQSFVMSVQYEAANAGPPANTGLVTLEWAAEAAFVNILYRETYEINSVLTTDCGRTNITDGMYGPFMRYVLEVGLGPASTTTLVLFGTNRPFTRTRAHELASVTARGISTDRVLVRHLATIAAGATTRRAIRIGPGRATLVFQAGAGGGPHNATVYSNADGINNGRIWAFSALAAGGEVTQAITMPRRACTVDLTNTGAAAATVGFIITADEN